jgi:hypothetical protein
MARSFQPARRADQPYLGISGSVRQWNGVNGLVCISSWMIPSSPQVVGLLEGVPWISLSFFSHPSGAHWQTNGWIAIAATTFSGCDQQVCGLNLEGTSKAEVVASILVDV